MTLKMPDRQFSGGFLLALNKGINMNKISVIIPVYNTEKFLPQCLGSVVNQTYKNLEIIIIDDGSPDNSAKIYNAYAQSDNRIRVIKQRNSGISAARNAGLDVATGDWVHFIDSDDYIDTDYYEKMIRSIGDMQPDILAGGVVSQNSPLYNVDYKTRCVLTSMTEKFVVTNALNNCTVWRYLFRREFLNKNKFKFAVGRIFEDMLFTPDAIRLANCIMTVPGVKYHYVFNEGSLLNKRYTPNHRAQYNYAQQHLLEFINKYNLLSVVERCERKETTVYKLIAFRLFKKVFFYDTNECKYYLFGVRILKTYKN